MSAAWSERAKKTLDSRPKIEADNAPLEQPLKPNLEERTNDAKGKRNLIQEVLDLLSSGSKSTQELATRLKVPYNPTLYHILVALRESGLIGADKGTVRRCRNCGQTLKGHYYRIMEQQSK